MKNRRGGGGAAVRAQGLTFQREPNASQNVLSCPGCDFSCATIMNLRLHLQETNHDQPPGAKTESESPKTGGPPADEVDDTVGIIPDHIKQIVFILKDYMQLSEREPIVGLEYVLEYRIQPTPDQPKRLRYFCQMCEADCDLVGMMEHLSCYRHRKLYLMKEYPYVLKAPSNARENRAQFMRRMAMEIEKEEAKKTYKMDTTLRTEPMKSAEAKQTRIKTRWNYEGDQQKRMRKAVEYLEKFEIDNDTEAATVTRLTEKLIAELKYHSDKLKEEALFPAKVARAKDVAMSIMQNTPRKPMPPKKDNPVLNPPPPAFNNPPPPAFTNPPPPVFNAGPPPPFNIPPPPVFNAGPPPPFNMPPPPLFNNPPPENNTNSVPPQPNPSWTPNTAFPPMAQNAENVPQIGQPNPGAQSEQPSEDNKFVKKLKLLLSVLQHNSTSADGGQVSSKFLMLKSLLQNKGGNTPTNQLPMHMGSMTPDMAGADNTALYQQLQLMASTNPAAMAQFAPNIMMQMASMTNSVVPMDNAQMGQHSMMQMAVQFQNSQMNANSFMPENRELVPEYGNMNPMIQNAYQNQYVEQQQEFPNTFQTNEGFGYDGQVPGNSAMRPVEEAPYTRVSLSPSNQRRERERFRDDGRDLRRDIRSLETRTSYGERRLLDEPAWEEGDSGTHYGKRARQDSDRMSSHSAERGRHYPDEGDAMGTNAPNLSVDLLKRIRGKDLFTVSAILSEYADNPSSR